MATTRSAGAGAAALAAAATVARTRGPGAIEQRIFRALNSGAGPMERPVWAVMQLGNGLSAIGVPVLLLATGHRREDALRTGVAAAGGWQLAKLVKLVVRRERPGALLDDVQLRDGDPGGRGFVSGHATVAMAIAASSAPLLGAGSRRALYAAAAVTALARVHVGAHLPLDVVGGAALGLLWGTVCRAGATSPAIVADPNPVVGYDHDGSRPVDRHDVLELAGGHDQR